MLVRTHPELIQPYNGLSSLNHIFPHTPLHLASRNGHKWVNILFFLQYSFTRIFVYTLLPIVNSLCEGFSKCYSLLLFVAGYFFVALYSFLIGVIFIRRAVVEVLLARGMNVNVRTSSGTALHEAALCGKTEVVRSLLENRTDLSIRDSKNNTVVDLLKEFPCHAEIYSLIRSKLGSILSESASEKFLIFQILFRVISFLLDYLKLSLL